MPSRNLVSIIISDMETHPSLPRLLQSVASQSIGLERTEILIAHNGNHSSGDASVGQPSRTDNVRQISLIKTYFLLRHAIAQQTVRMENFLFSYVLTTGLIPNT